MNKSALPLPTEDEECVLLVDYLNALRMQKKIRRFTKIPNETFTKSWSQKRKNKRQGLNPGFPDYVILLKRRILFIEMKRRKLSTVSPEQQEWHRDLQELNLGIYVCRGFDEAKAAVEAAL